MSVRHWHADAERLHEDLAAYALDALEPDEAAELERHIDGCSSCRDRVDWLRPAVDLLPASVEQRTPPPELRESLLATVRAEAATTAPSAEPARERRPSRWWDLRGLMARPGFAMAALILLTVGVAAGYLVRGTGEEPQSTFVSAEPAPGQSQVSATLERHGESATLHVEQMPEIGRDEVYEVWVQRGDAVEPASTFVLGMDGTAEAAVPGPLEGATAVLVTAEPRPGGPQPTSPPLLEARI